MGANAAEALGHQPQNGMEPARGWSLACLSPPRRSVILGESCSIPPTINVRNEEPTGALKTLQPCSHLRLLRSLALLPSSQHQGPWTRGKKSAADSNHLGRRTVDPEGLAPCQKHCHLHQPEETTTPLVCIRTVSSARQRARGRRAPARHGSWVCHPVTFTPRGL